MTVDYPNAIDMVITDPSRVFVGALVNVPHEDLSIVIHKTASGGQTSAQALARYFKNNADKVSSHFIVGKDGSVVQCVSLYDGAAANCCTSSGYDSYWVPFVKKYGNLNVCTISIEHEDWTSDNTDVMPQSQVDASNKLILWLCQRYAIPTSRIKGHASIDPGNKSRCPGPTFSFSKLLQYIGVDTTSKYVQQAAQDTWNSTAHLFGGTPLSYSTGIAKSWHDLYVNQRVNMPPPTTREFKSVDWSGNAIIVQFFGTVRCEWVGSATWINTNTV